MPALRLRAIGVAVLVFSYPAMAMPAEVQSVHLASRVQVADADLVLNGAGVRKRVFLNVYVAALYLSRRERRSELVLSDGSPHRFSIQILRDEVSAEQLLAGFHEGLQANNSPGTLAAVEAGVRQLEAIFTPLKLVKKDQLILFDYLPDARTRISLDGEVKGTIAGADFNRALMRIWLGERPVDANLKKALLGGVG